MNVSQKQKYSISKLQYYSKSRPKSCQTDKVINWNGISSVPVLNFLPLYLLIQKFNKECLIECTIQLLILSIDCKQLQTFDLV